MSTLVFDNASNYVGTHKVPNKNWNNGSVKATGNTSLNSTFQTAGKDRASMEAQLQTFSGTTYTNTYLLKLTYNDLVHALRMAYDSANI